MNDDSTSTSSSAADEAQRHANVHRHGRDRARDSQSDARAQSPLHSSSRRPATGLVRKLDFITHLMTSLDMLVFAELCVLYYMDCSFFRLCLRSLAQYMFLTPKPSDIVILLPAHRPHVVAIFLPNVLCILLHLFLSLPEAEEAARGYLHGGVIVDFVGQKAPTSKFSLILLDLVVMALQCLMLAVHMERDRLRKLVRPVRRRSSGAEEDGRSSAGQDLDAEERGVFRDAPVLADDPDDIELQSLPDEAGGREQRSDDHGESSSLGAQGGGVADLYDTLRSGNAIITDLHVLHAISTARNDHYQRAITAYSLGNLNYTATLAAIAEHRARVESQRR